MMIHLACDMCYGELKKRKVIPTMALHLDELQEQLHLDIWVAREAMLINCFFRIGSTDNH